MKKKFALSFVALASVALLAACGEVKSGASNTTGNPVDEKTIKIGFNFEETGAVAAYGTAEQKGAQLAVDEINAAGGIDGKQIEVVDKDNKSETAEAASVTTNLVTQSKVAAIVGPATSGATAAAVANATKAGVPLISPSATQDGLTKGQASPRSDIGFVTKTTPHGAFESPLSVCETAIAAGATFVAQSYMVNRKELVDLIQQAMDHEGFSFINVFSPCVTYNKRNSYDWFKEHLVALPEGYDPTDRAAALKTLGDTDGLGWFEGQVKRFLPNQTDAQGGRLKVPHMGWNTVCQTRTHPLFQDIGQDEYFYFVH